MEESCVGAVFRELTIRLRTEGMEVANCRNLFSFSCMCSFQVLSLPGMVALAARLSAMRLLLSEHYRYCSVATIPA